MREVWLESYPLDIKTEIDMNEFSSINDMVARSCHRFARRPAFVSFGTTITYAEVDALSRNFAAALQSTSGLQKGSRVALMMPNLLQYPVSLFGVFRAGMVAVNVNPMYTPRELEHQLKDSGAEAIVILENFAHTLEKVLPNITTLNHVITTEVGDLLPPRRRWLVNQAVKRVKRAVPKWRIPGTVSFRKALRKGAKSQLREPTPTHTDIAFLQYTGGTTGDSKAAVLTHGNIVANLLQASAWAAASLEEGSEIAVTALPLYHIFSLTIGCLLFTRLGGMQVLIADPRNLRGFVKELSDIPFTMMTGVNTLFNGLLNTPGFDGLDFSRLKYVVGGGAAIHRSVAEQWEKVTGRPLIEGYGLTEASPLVACNPLPSRYSGAIGLPMPSTDISIRDDNNAEVGLGYEGEICIRGPQVTQGYWHQPEETEKAITSDGWLRTGDIGVMDERGYVRVTDRKKDMILVSGFNVYPNEVEAVISSMTEISECAVISVPNAVTGEAIKAFVVARDPGLTAEAIIAFCREHLTNYKMPKLVEFRTELPKNPIGKVLRRELRAAEAAARETEAGAAKAAGGN